MKMTFFLPRMALWVLLLMSAFVTSAQTTYFEPVSSAQARTAAPTVQNIEKYVLYQLKDVDLRGHLAKAPLEFHNNGASLRLDIPLPNGTVETFAMLESPILSPAVAAVHPEIKTYTGMGTAHRNYTIRFSFTISGFDAIILGVEGDAVYYTKVSADPANRLYITYFARDAKRPQTTMPFGRTGGCSTVSTAVDLKLANADKQGRVETVLNNTGTTLRTFKLAVAATGEFTLRKGGGNRLVAFAALLAYVNRLNCIFRTELSVAFKLVSDENLVYPDPTDDPYSNPINNLDAMEGENQRNLDNVITNEKYDVGFVLSSTGASPDGRSAIGTVCDKDNKGRSVVRLGSNDAHPVFDDHRISHEMGHRFNMTHTFNSDLYNCGVERKATTAVEPGSGTTIMTYPNLCGDDNYEQNYLPLLHFHTISYRQAVAFIAKITPISCFSVTSLNNAVPVISTMRPEWIIPNSTPFALTGTATDADAADVLTYSWEGIDIATGVLDSKTLASTTQPPFFRSYAPVLTGTRMFPRLEAILDGSNYAKGDKLPSVGITTYHQLTVRDNKGGVSYYPAFVTMAGNSGPFLETTNLAGSYPGNSSKTITWDVANTTALPVNCPKVDILLSTDGGLTFPTTLTANTDNDGSQTVTLPNVSTDQARIKVAASNNIFFDISNKNFGISGSEPDSGLIIEATDNEVCVGESVDLSVTATEGTAPFGYTWTAPAGATLSATNTSAVSATFTTAGIQTFTMTVADAASPPLVTTGTVSVTVNASPTRLYVNVAATGANTGLNWTDAFINLQSALNYKNEKCSQNLTEIWVAGGTYYPTDKSNTESPRDKSFVIPNEVKVYGGFACNEQNLEDRKLTTPSSTILSGDIGIPNDKSDNSYHVVSFSNATDQTLLDGFVITGGNADGTGLAFSEIGGGIYNVGKGEGNNSNPTLVKLTIIGNSASDRGGAMCNYGLGGGTSSSVLTDVMFKSNAAGYYGGALYNDVSGSINSVLTSVTFTSNTATSGGAIYDDGSGSESGGNLILNNVRFVDNVAKPLANSGARGEGGAMYIVTGGDNSSPVLTSVTFTSNTASDQGGAIYNDAHGGNSPVLTNVSFASNTAVNGGAMYNIAFVGNNSPMLTNVSFASNTAVNGGAMYNASLAGNSNPVMTNVSFANNSASAQGGAIYRSLHLDFFSPGVTSTLTNGVVFGNGGSNTFVDGDGNGGIFAYDKSLTVRYSLLESSVPTSSSYIDGGNNRTTTSSPFVSSTDLRLVAGSVGIDAGDNAANTNPTDLAGKSRIVNGTIDMGAFETQAANTAPVATANANQTATVGVAFSYVVKAFTDNETPTTLTYSALINPANGFTFDAATRIFSGTPVSMGVTSVTITATDPGGLSASTTFIITVTQTSTRPLSLSITASPVRLLTTGTTTLSAIVSGGVGPYAYSFSGPGSILINGNSATVSNLLIGRQTFTVTVTDATTPISQSSTGTVSVTVTVTGDNTPPEATLNDSQTATVGVAFSHSVNAFVDKETPDGLTYSARIDPVNGLVFDPATRIISGTPIITGVSGVTVTATDPGSLSASTTFTILVKPASVSSTPPFAITGVTTIACTPVGDQINLNFNPRYAGLNGQPISFSIANELSSTTQSGPYSLRIYPDNPVITLKATQSGTAGEASFTYNWLAACNNTAPLVITGVTTVSCETVSVNERRVRFNPQYTGASGQPVSFSVFNELAPTTAAGPYTLKLYIDNPTITLKATQVGTTGEASFSYNWLAACDAAGPPITTPFSITGVTTISCTIIEQNRRQVIFAPRYSGSIEEPITFQVVNELSPTTAPAPYTLNLYTDNPVIILKVMLPGTGSEVSFSYNWLAACNGSGGRSGVDPSVETTLDVRLLGNPVEKGQLWVEVRGAVGQPLEMSLTDVRGLAITSHRVEKAGSIEQHTFQINRQSAGSLLLRATTPTQSQTVKVLKAN